jgi:hypothetical protein
VKLTVIGIAATLIVSTTIILFSFNSDKLFHSAPIPAVAVVAS